MIFDVKYIEDSKKVNLQICVKDWTCTGSLNPFQQQFSQQQKSRRFAERGFKGFKDFTNTERKYGSLLALIILLRVEV